MDTKIDCRTEPSPLEATLVVRPRKNIDRQKAEKISRELAAYIESHEDVKEYYSTLSGN